MRVKVVEVGGWSLMRNIETEATTSAQLHAELHGLPEVESRMETHTRTALEVLQTDGQWKRCPRLLRNVDLDADIAVRLAVLKEERAEQRRRQPRTVVTVEFRAGPLQHVTWARTTLELAAEILSRFEAPSMKAGADTVLEVFDTEWEEWVVHASLDDVTRGPSHSLRVRLRTSPVPLRPNVARSPPRNNPAAACTTPTPAPAVSSPTSAPEDGVAATTQRIMVVDVDGWAMVAPVTLRPADTRNVGAAVARISEHEEVSKRMSVSSVATDDIAMETFSRDTGAWFVVVDVSSLPDRALVRLRAQEPSVVTNSGTTTSTTPPHTSHRAERTMSPMLQREMDILMKTRACKSCTRQLACVVLEPCRHMPLCGSCAPTATACPLCSTEITSFATTKTT